jgi:hypothetical protein
MLLFTNSSSELELTSKLRTGPSRWNVALDPEESPRPLIDDSGSEIRTTADRGLSVGNWTIKLGVEVEVAVLFEGED